MLTGIMLPVLRRFKTDPRKRGKHRVRFDLEQLQSPQPYFRYKHKSAAMQAGIMLRDCFKSPQLCG